MSSGQTSSVDEIKQRWKTAKLFSAWTQLAAERRQRVSAELEETATELRDDQPELAADLTAALDALDALSLSGHRQLLEDMERDVGALISALDDLSAKRG